MAMNQSPYNIEEFFRVFIRKNTKENNVFSLCVLLLLYFHGIVCALRSFGAKNSIWIELCVFHFEVFVLLIRSLLHHGSLRMMFHPESWVSSVFWVCLPSCLLPSLKNHRFLVILLPNYPSFGCSSRADESILRPSPIFSTSNLYFSHFFSSNCPLDLWFLHQIPILIIFTI